MRPLAVFGLLAACNRREPYYPPDTASTEAGVDTADDSGGLLAVTSVSHELAKPRGTVAVVTFSAEGTGDGVVRFGVDGEPSVWEVAASPTDDGGWQALLIGVPAEMTGWYQVGLGGDYDETVYTYETAEAPSWTRATLEGTPGHEGFLALAVTGLYRGALIIDLQGRPVWWWSAASDQASLHIRAALSPDHSALWFNAFTIEPAHADRDEGAIIKAAFDGSGQEVFSYPTSHHDFLIHDDGTLALPVLDDRDVDGTTIRGDAIVEISPDGAERTVWSSWDAVTYRGEGGFPEGWWTMVNHIQYVAEDDDYVVSMKNISTLARVDGETGATEWLMGGGDQTIVPDTPFHGQHGFDVLSAEELLLFDNAGDEAASRIQRIALEPDKGRATTTDIYSDGISSFVMGDVMEFDDGGMLVSWSTASTIDEIDQSGQRVSRLTFEEAETVGYLSFYPSIGPRP